MFVVTFDDLISFIYQVSKNKDVTVLQIRLQFCSLAEQHKSVDDWSQGIQAVRLSELVDKNFCEPWVNRGSRIQFTLFS